MKALSVRARLSPDKVAVESNFHSTMKKTLFLLGLLSVAALASCSIKDDLQQPEQARRFRAVLEQPASGATTKVYVDDTYHLFWNKGDLVSIFYDRTLNRQFMFDGDTGDTAGGFNRSDEDPTFSSEQDIETGYNYAIFPWHRRNACDTQGNLKVIIPDVQEFYDDQKGIGARMLMVARAENGDFFFKHVGSYIGVRLIGEGVSVKSISFQGNGSEILAGRPSVSFGEDGLPVLTFDPTSEDNATIITMELESPVVLSMDKPKVFWLQVPAISLSGYTMTVTDPDGGTFQKVRTEPLTFQRTYFYDLDATVVITPKPVEVTEVSVTPGTLSLTVGGEASLEATVLPENADDKTVTWSSSAPGVASVNESGKVSALSAGTATITATAGGKSASCMVTVSDDISYSLALSPATATIDARETQEYTATLTTVKNGETTTSAVNATLNSSDFGVATISGMVATGVADGTATITAKYTPAGSTELTATASLTVKDVYEYRLALTPATAEINVGATQTYTATLTTIKNGGTPSTSTVTATLSSSSGAATVDGMVVTGASAGTATITAKYTPAGSTELTATATLTVKNVYEYRLAIDPESAEIIVNSTKKFVAKLFTTTNGTEDQGSEVTATWSITSGGDYAAIATDGTATGVKEGTATITAKYTPAGSSELTATASLKVNKDPNHAGDPIVIGPGGSF